MLRTGMEPHDDGIRKQCGPVYTNVEHADSTGIAVVRAIGIAGCGVCKGSVSALKSPEPVDRHSDGQQGEQRREECRRAEGHICDFPTFFFGTKSSYNFPALNLDCTSVHMHARDSTSEKTI